jgi:hypothetical protein
MATLAETMKRATAITGHDIVVPPWVLIEKRRQRAERCERVAATIMGQADTAG